MQLRHRHFRGTWVSWADLFDQAADFATACGSKSLFSISHSADESNGTVTVWYRHDKAASSKAGRDRVKCQYFRGTWSSWQDLFRQAGDFASEIGLHRLISISHSDDQSNGVVTVWYWG